jgi:hypothetical protein
MDESAWAAPAKREREDRLRISPRARPGDRGARNPTGPVPMDASRWFSGVRPARLAAAGAKRAFHRKP